MKKLSVVQPISVVLAVLLFVSAAISATTSRRTKITFSGSVRVPGATLKAGTYYFQAPEFTHRALVRIVDENGQFITQFMGIAEQTRKPDHDVIAFGDHECGAKAIKSWFYPHSGTVVRFVYSEEEAASIAAACNEPVPESHQKNLNASQLENYPVHLMTPDKREEAYDPGALTASDQRDRDGFNADPD
jgi:hypothetical protein